MRFEKGNKRGRKFGHGKGNQDPRKGGRPKGSKNKKTIMKQFLSILINDPNVHRRNGLTLNGVVDPNKVMTLLDAIDLRVLSIALYGKPAEALKAREMIWKLTGDEDTSSDNDHEERRNIRTRVTNEKLKLLERYKIEEHENKE